MEKWFKEIKNFIRAMQRPFIVVSIILLIGWVIFQVFGILSAMITTGAIPAETVVTIVTTALDNVVNWLLAAGATIIGVIIGMRRGDKKDDEPNGIPPPTA